MTELAALHEVSAVLHVHSRYSDGRGTVHEIVSAARATGVEVLWLTDHDTLAARAPSEDGPGEGWVGRTLLLVGVEVTPAQNHYLCFGGDGVPDRTRSFAEYSREAAAMGHLGFVAHPDDPGSRVLRLPSYRWSDREGDNYQGLEIWNHLSQWMRGVRGVGSGIWAVRHPFLGSDRPTPENLALWDYLGRTRRVVGVAGVDAHAVVVGRPPLGVVVFPYATSFQTVRTHILTAAPLTEVDARRDRDRLKEALAAGRVLCVSGQVGGFCKGFRFWATVGERVVWLGGEVAWADGAALHIASPLSARFRLYRDGELAAEHTGRGWTHPASGPGVWRVEADLARGSRWLPWVVANPVYLRAPRGDA